MLSPPLEDEKVDTSACLGRGGRWEEEAWWQDKVRSFEKLDGAWLGKLTSGCFKPGARNILFLLKVLDFCYLSQLVHCCKSLPFSGPCFFSSVKWERWVF